ncbi:MAG: hypothetical protein KC619_01115 [Myxococcales bacterium]|nr:hypothetical protein [Myxococcales bacterium]
MTEAKLYAIGSFLIRSRNLLVIVGDVLEGEVRTGMTIHVPFGTISITHRVASIERVEVTHEGKLYVGLALEYGSEADLELALALCPEGGETLLLRAEAS